MEPKEKSLEEKLKDCDHIVVRGVVPNSYKNTYGECMGCKDVVELEQYEHLPDHQLMVHMYDFERQRYYSDPVQLYRLNGQMPEAPTEIMKRMAAMVENDDDKKLEDAMKEEKAKYDKDNNIEPPKLVGDQ